MNIGYTDGTNQSVVTDSSWLGREGEHRFDSVYMGTAMDLTRKPHQLIHSV